MDVQSFKIRRSLAAQPLAVNDDFASGAGNGSTKRVKFLISSGHPAFCETPYFELNAFILYISPDQSVQASNRAYRPNNESKIAHSGRNGMCRVARVSDQGCFKVRATIITHRHRFFSFLSQLNS